MQWRFIAYVGTVLMIVGCAALPTARQRTASTQPLPHTAFVPASLQSPLFDGDAAGFHSPALVSFSADSNRLQFWGFAPHGGSHPVPLSARLPVGSVAAMAGDGHVLALAVQNPSSVLLYDIRSRKTTRLADPFGVPIDIAIGRNEALYVMDYATPPNVAVYEPHSNRPQEVGCNRLYFGQAIAVDNEDDVFINSYTVAGPAGVVEIPNGPGGLDPKRCTTLALKEEPGYLAGIAVDPQTDALVVLDDPDYCAGGIEGRMTIYPKPYSRFTGRSRNLGANCAGLLRLDAESKRVFVLDEDVSGSYTFVLQRSYPDGRDMGFYIGGQPTGFTAVPNSLPN